jgi:hypothetical protein
MRRLLRKARRAFRDLRAIRRLVTGPERSATYSPEGPRKSQAQVAGDLLLWFLRHREVNEYYFWWGMDRVDGPRARDLLSYRRFRALRDGRNRHDEVSGLDYIALMRDKYLFGLVVEALGFPTPRTVALTTPEAVEWLRPRQAEPLSSLAGLPSGTTLFYKPRFGVQGKGVFRLDIEGGGLRIDGQEASLEGLAARVEHGLLQEAIVQHPALSALHPHAVNTLRVITVRDGEGARVFSRPMLRIGLGESVVDNGRSGGLQVFVDPETGRLLGPGLLTPGGLRDRHPDTGALLDGFEVPHYAEALALAVRLHHELPGLHTIGWDLAITEGGAVFIEGNDNWAAGLRLGLEPGFKEAFEALFAQR